MIREPLTTPTVDIEDIRVVGVESGEVPEFEVLLADGTQLKSSDWIGKSPFVVAFFATWCQVCEMKMPMVRTALSKVAEARLLLVSVDEPDTWHHVPGFLKEQRLGDVPVVSALEHPRFAIGYNPMGAVPLVVVVGRDGTLVDYQVGLRPDDGPRLEAAIRQAAEK